MRGRRVLVGASIALLASAACSAYSGTSGDAADAGSDAVPTDGPFGSDDAPEPTEAGDAASPRCDGAVTLMDDFNTGIDPVWTKDVQGPGAVATSAMLAGGAVPTSPPLALAASLDFLDAGGTKVYGEASLDLLRNVVPTSVHLTHTMSVVQKTSVFGSLSCSIHFQSASPYAETILDLVTIGSTMRGRIDLVAEDASAPPDTVLGPYTNGTWYDVELHANVANAMVTATWAMKPHGATISPATATVGPAPLPANVTSFAVKCGIEYADNGGAMLATRLDVAMDDLALVVCPR